MNELCSFYLPSLPLYLEGELRDRVLSERIRRHLLCCPECREEAQRHQDLSDSIFAAFYRGSRMNGASGPPGVVDEAEEEVAAAGRTGRILAAVRRLEARRRQVSRRRIAAALLAAAMAGAAVFLGLRERPERSTAGAPVAEAVPPAPRSNDGGEVEMIRWLLDREVIAGQSPPRLTASGGSPGEARLLGVAHRVRHRRDGTWVEMPGAGGLPVRWVLRVRLREPYHDPLGGGWTYLVPDAVEAASGPAEPLRLDSVIPVRRVALYRSSSEEIIPRTIWKKEQGSSVYRILVVPDPGEPLDPPNTPLPGSAPIIPGKLMRDLENPFQRY